MRPARRCSRTGCVRPAVATLTYAYAESTAVVGPLAMLPEPHTYDLCEYHALHLTAPRGWEVLRPDGGDFGEVEPTTDDLLALADAVREAARPPSDPTPVAPSRGPSSRGRRGHLSVVPPQR